MFVIYSLADLRCLREAAAVPAQLIDQIEANLRDLHAQFSEDQPLEDFTLAPFGPVAILQPGDGPGIHDALGISHEVLIMRPEWVGRSTVGGVVVYQVITVLDNESAACLYVPQGVLPPGDERHLAAEAEDE